MLVLLQPSRAWQTCQETLAAGRRLRRHVHTSRKQNQQNLDWELLGLTLAAVATLTRIDKQRLLKPLI